MIRNFLIYRDLIQSHKLLELDLDKFVKLFDQVKPRLKDYIIEYAFSLILYYI